MPRKKSALFYLTPSERAELRKRLRAPDNLDWLLICICLRFRDHILPVFQTSDPNGTVLSADDTAWYVRRIGETVYRAVIEKLKVYFPNEADKDEATLVRWYPDKAGELLEQALGRMVDLWNEDLIRQPSDFLPARCQRLLPSLNYLPDMRGKSAHGETSWLLLLVVYKDVLQLLNPFPRIIQFLTQDDLQQRERTLRKLRRALPRNIHPATKTIFRDASDQDYEYWLRLSSRDEVALEITVQVAERNGHKLTANYLRRLIPQLEARAQRLDKALKHA